MSRLVPYAGSRSSTAGATPAGPTGSSTGASVQERLEAIAKYIPAEILAFFLPAVGVVQLFDAAERRVAHWFVFIVAWVAVPAYFKWIARGDDRAGRQMIVSSLAFPIWAYATNREAGALGPWFTEPRALLALLIFSLVTGFLMPKRAS